MLDEPELGVLLLNGYLYTFETEAARALVRELTPVFEDRGNDRLHRRFVNFQGILAMRQSSFAEAETLFRRVEWMSNLAKDDATLSFAFANLGHVELLRFRGAEALPHYARALMLARAQRSSRVISTIFWGTARTYSDLEMYPEAQRDFETARRHQRNVHETAFLDISEATMLAQSGRLEAAARLAHRAKAFFESRSQRIGVAPASMVLARVAASSGALESARTELEHARQAFTGTDLLMGAEIEEERAVIAALSGDETTRAEAEERAAEIYISIESPGRAERMRRRVTLARSSG
ncbi:MAG TPA: hypothetical protein VF092_15010 [Longimicrobium sp.]